VSDTWPPAFRPVLSRVATAGVNLFDEPVSGVEPLRQMDRPFSSLLQVRVSLRSRTVGAFVKLLKPRVDSSEEVGATRHNVRREFETTRDVRDGLASYPGLSTVRPIACYPDLLAMVTEEAPGPTLTDLLRRSTAPGLARVRGLERIVAETGRWLSAAQAVLPPARQVTAEKIRAYLDVRLAALERDRDMPLTAEGRAAIERCRDRLLEASAGELGPVWIHADFCPENVIVGAEGIVVLDFTMATGGTKYHDVSHLFLRLETMKAKPWCRRAVVDRLQAALLRGFEPGLTASRPLFQLFLLQHVVCHMLAMLTTGGDPGSTLHRWQVRRQLSRHRRWLASRTGLPLARMFRRGRPADGRLAALRGAIGWR
jgi:hypothetical protein